MASYWKWRDTSHDALQIALQRNYPLRKNDPFWKGKQSGSAKVGEPQDVHEKQQQKIQRYLRLA